MAYSKEYWGPKESKKETPEISLELLAQQKAKEKERTVDQQGQVITNKERQEEIKRKLELGHEQQ